MTRDDILDKVRKTLVDSLNVDDDQVKMESRLKGDLGAESIDFLDIVFRLDQQFKQYGFTINREELFPESIFQGDAKFVANGKVTEFGLAELEKQMPYADLSDFRKDPKIDRVEDLFTVELIVRYLEWKIASKK